MFGNAVLVKMKIWVLLKTKKNTPKSDICILWNRVLCLYVYENITEYFYLVCCWLHSMGNNHSYIVSVFSLRIQLVSILSFRSNFLAQKTTSVYSVEGNWDIRKIEKGRKGCTWSFNFFLFLNPSLLCWAFSIWKQ